MLHGVSGGDAYGTDEKKEEKEDKAQPKTKYPQLNEFHCSISTQIFKDPVILEDGHTYERADIEVWLTRSDRSPLTGKKLASKKLTPNWTLKKAIAEYEAKIIPKFKVEAEQIAALHQSLASTTKILKATRKQLEKTEALLVATQQELEKTAETLEINQSILAEAEARLAIARNARERCGFFSVSLSNPEEERLLSPVPRNRVCGRLC